VRAAAEGVWSARWLLAVPAATLLLPAVVLGVGLHDQYRGEVLVQVRPLRPENIGHALPQEPGDRSDEVMPAVRDRVLSVAHVEAALPILAPDAPAGDRALAQEARERFVYQLVGHSAFSVRLDDRDPKVAAEAVNALVRSFLEGERADRLRRAESKAEFHQRELADARAEHARVLERIQAFRGEHAESLPERKEFLESELRRLESERTSLVGVREAGRQRALSLEQQVVALFGDAERGPSRAASMGEEALRLRLSKDQEVLATAQKQLAEASVRYTDRHPDVVRLKAMVGTYQAAVEETLAALGRLRREEEGRAAESVEARLQRRRESLEQMLLSAERAVEGVEQQLAENQRRQAAAQASLDHVPLTAAAYQPLEREWAEARTGLEARERDAAAARAAADFYRRGDVGDVTGYRVNAWAVPAVRPSGPKRWRYPATALLLAAVVSYGLLRLRQRFQREAVVTRGDVEVIFPDAVVVPLGVDAGPRRQGAAWLREGLLATYVVLAVGASVWLVLAHRGVVEAPTWMRPLLGHLA
jgi:uncharacterized protein involved in exopolysaccharide biosynthesis